MPTFHSLLVVVTLLTPALLAGQSGARITTAEIDGHLRFLSSDLLEGRAPATRGGRLAAEYIASQLRAAGVEPGANGSYFQSVPIDIVAAQPSTIRATASGRGAATLRYPEDVVIWAGGATETSAARGELVFVGYGSAGMLIVHTEAQAGYPWHTVVGSWAKEQRMLPRDPTLPSPLGVQGWISDERAAALLQQAGLDLAALRAKAAVRDFRPVPMGITLDLGFTNRVQHLTSVNVVGVVRGRDARLGRHYEALSAHWDHLGLGAPVNGDSIYNGASDNASGVADLLAIARAAVAAPRPKRSLLFVFVTAEESGLLGSAWFAQHPTVPTPQIVANLNMDGGNRARQLSEIAPRFALQVANAPGVPTWSRDAEFRALRPAPQP